MANMTRAEAICAATNILDLLDELYQKLNDKFPNNYHESVLNQCTSMRERIKKNAQYAHITENMDGWFRKTWAGLCKWDHDDEFNDELFAGLSDVILELQQEAEASGEPTEPSKKTQKGRESTNDEMSKELDGLVTPETQERAKAAQKAAANETSTVHAVEGLVADGKSVGTDNRAFADQVKETTVARFKESVVRLREERISVVLSQVVAKNIRLVDKSIIHHCDIEHILKKTSSDRTQQLIMAAFLAGKIAGIHDLSSELKGSV